MPSREVAIIAQAASIRLHKGLPIRDLLELYPWLPDVTDDHGRTLLHVAFYYGRPDAIMSSCYVPILESILGCDVPMYFGADVKSITQNATVKV